MLHFSRDQAALLGPRAHPVQCDVTDSLSVRVAARELSGLGGSELFVLVNNAGVAIDLPWIAPPLPASAAADTLSVNVYGAERLSRMLMPQVCLVCPIAAGWTGQLGLSSALELKPSSI